MNISRIAAKLSQLEGTSAKIKLGGKQMMELAKKSDEPAVAEALQKALSKYPKAQAEVAYKVSEQGFTVGAIEIKNGKEVIGRGAASVTGFGTETPIAKMRLNIGKNGEVYTGSSYVDLGKTPKIEDLECALSVKKGIITTEANAGDFIGGYQRLDTKKAAEMFGLEKIGTEVLDEGNNVLKEVIKKLRKIVSGKEEKVKAKMVAKDIEQAFAGKAGTGKKNVSEAIEKLAKDTKPDFTEKTKTLKKNIDELKEKLYSVPEEKRLEVLKKEFDKTDAPYSIKRKLLTTDAKLVKSKYEAILKETQYKQFDELMKLRKALHESVNDPMVKIFYDVSETKQILKEIDKKWDSLMQDDKLKSLADYLDKVTKKS